MKGTLDSEVEYIPVEAFQLFALMLALSLITLFGCSQHAAKYIALVPHPHQDLLDFFDEKLRRHEQLQADSELLASTQ
jgi:hypothetical protein